MNKKIRFYLRKPNAQGKAAIYVRCYCKDGDFRYPTGITIAASEWDDQRQETFFDRRVNAELFKIYDYIDKYLLYCDRMGKKDIYQSDLEKELNEKLNKQEKVKKVVKSDSKNNHFFTCIDRIIEKCESGDILTPKGTIYTSGSLKNLRKTRGRLFEFNPNLDFSTISLQVYNEFITFCNKRKYTLNYTSALVKDWKTFMGLAIKEGYSKNMIHKHSDFKRVNEDSFQVYLNDEEIKKLLELDLSKDKYREAIRDRFVINLYTGFRVSDMKTFDLRNIHNDVITHINKKTGKRVAMPVHPVITSIIKKYEGKLPRQYADQVVNREIKEIAKKAGFTELIHYVQTVGGVKQNFVNEKWELITNHTCRRSMASNLLKHADFSDVMPVMGMSMKTLQIYNKRSIEENAHMLKQNPFFRKAAE